MNPSKILNLIKQSNEIIKLAEFHPDESLLLSRLPLNNEIYDALMEESELPSENDLSPEEYAEILKKPVKKAGWNLVSNVQKVYNEIPAQEKTASEHQFKPMSEWKTPSGNEVMFHEHLSPEKAKQYMDSHNKAIGNKIPEDIKIIGSSPFGDYFGHKGNQHYYISHEDPEGKVIPITPIHKKEKTAEEISPLINELFKIGMSGEIIRQMKGVPEYEKVASEMDVINKDYLVKVLSEIL